MTCSKYESPRARRLRSDRLAMQRLQEQSSVLRFRASGDPPDRYLVELRGKSLVREHGKVIVREVHQVEIKLGASYPRSMPELRWLTPIYHPNISEIGLVCLGGYNTHWVPSLQLDELCEMLWDMARFHNYDLKSPYNREAALWAANQSKYTFPADHRPLRNLRVAEPREPATPAASVPASRPDPRAEASGDTEGAMFLILDEEDGTDRAAADPASRSEPPPDVIFID